MPSQKKAAQLQAAAQVPAAQAPATMLGKKPPASQQHKDPTKEDSLLVEAQRAARKKASLLAAADTDSDIKEQVSGNSALDLGAETRELPIWMTGEQVLDNGTTLYLAFEQITEQNAAYWKYYIEKFAQCMISYEDFHKGLGRYLSQNDWQLRTKEKFREYFEKQKFFSQPKPHHITFLDKSYDYLSNKPDKQPLKEAYEKIHNILHHTPSGIMGDLVHASKDSKYNFMVYASTRPINEESIISHCQLTDPVKNSRDLSFYDDMILSVPFATEKESLTFSHFGLFKNPWHLTDERYKNLTMIVSGFSATCAERLKDTIGEKLYFSTAPLESLVRILSKAIGKKNIHIISCGRSKQEGPSQFGDNIARQINEKNYRIIDPETNKETREFPSLVIAGFNLEFPKIVISAQRFKPFYDNSNAIQDTQAMLSSLRYLQSVQSPLPDGLSKQICKQFPEIIEGEEKLTLDEAIEHYQSLGAQHDPLSASLPDFPPSSPRP